VHAYVQRLVSVVKMATVFEGSITGKQRFIMVFFCGQRDSVQRVFITSFHVYDGKCLSRKAVHNWATDVSLMTKRLKPEARKWLRQRSEDCGCPRTGKAMGKVYQCWWRICREVNVFCRFKYRMFCDLYQFMTYLLTLPRVFVSSKSAASRNSPCLVTQPLNKFAVFYETRRVTSMLRRARHWTLFWECKVLHVRN
jgi:hypothetical protein